MMENIDIATEGTISATALLHHGLGMNKTGNEQSEITPSRVVSHPKVYSEDCSQHPSRVSLWTGALICKKQVQQKHLPHFLFPGLA